MSLYPEANRFDRMEALRIYTTNAAWFSNEEGNKGAITPGQLADLAVLSEDYFSIPEERIKSLESVLTIVNGKPVYATDEFQTLAPPPLPVSPDWSPVAHYGGYHNKTMIPAASSYRPSPLGCCSPTQRSSSQFSSALLSKVGSLAGFWGGMGCACSM
jgi:hypothetical protein